MDQLHAGRDVAVLRPLGVAEILDGAVRLVRTNARAALTVSVPVAVIVTVVRALLTYATVDSPDTTFGALVGSLVTSTWAGVLVTGVLAPVYGATLLGSPRTVRATLARPVRTLGVLIVLGAVIAVSETAGLVALAVGGVWLWGVWAVAAPACTTEGLGVGAALGRSTRLVRNAFWRTWGVRALGWLLVYVLSAIVTVPLQLLATVVAGNQAFDTKQVTDATLYVVITAVGGLLASALLAPLLAAIDTLIYTDLRMRKEGLDIVLALGQAPGPQQPEPTQQSGVTAW